MCVVVFSFDFSFDKVCNSVIDFVANQKRFAKIIKIKVSDTIKIIDDGSEEIGDFENMKLSVYEKMEDHIKQGWNVHIEAASICLYFLEFSGGKVKLTKSLLIRHQQNRHKIITAEMLGQPFSLVGSHKISTWDHLRKMLDSITGTLSIESLIAT